MTNIAKNKKEIRVVFSPDAHARLLIQAAAVDQTPASFARQVIMEKVTALEAAGSQGASVVLLKKMLDDFPELLEDAKKE